MLITRLEYRLISQIFSNQSYFQKTFIQNQMNYEKEKNILDLLMSNSLIDNYQRKIIEIESKKHNISEEKCILKLNLLSQETLLKIKKELNKNKYNISDFIIDSELIKKVPIEFCLSRKCLPINLTDSCLYVAMTFNDVNILKELDLFLKFKSTKVIISEDNEIRELILKNYNNDSNWIAFIEKHDEKSLDLFIDRLIFDAISKNASDIHFSCDEYIVRLRYRIDGDLVKICVFHKDYYGRVLVKLKVIFSVDITTSFKPRDGSMSRVVMGKRVDFRISFHQCIYGENVAIRILNNVENVSIDQIGYSEIELKKIREMISRKSGIVVFIGPTGSGKTTSLYASINEIDKTKYNIMTVEDPVECYLKGVQQTDINQHPEMTFSSCLRSILRQDPDIILIGEIRDSETANMAIRASMTGHKVFTTLHARDVFCVVDRFAELGAPKSLCINNIVGIVSQRLIRKTCENCLGIGCIDCFYSFYKGRSVISESLIFNQEIIQLFHENTSNEVRKKLSNFKSMKEDGLEKCKRGIFSEKDVLYFSEEEIY